MRWLWIDRLITIEIGRRAQAIKCISRSEEELDGHFCGYPIFPHSLMIEGMAQTAGILLGASRGFRDDVVLAKISFAEFTDYARPADVLCYDANLQSFDDRGGITTGQVTRNGELIGRVDLIFSHLSPGSRPTDVPSESFVFAGDLFNLFRDQLTEAMSAHQESPNASG